MTNKTAFTPDEWLSVIEGPTSAGLVVVTASHGGVFRETFAMSKAYVEARSAHGGSELLDEIVSSKPKLEHAHAHSPEELKADALQRVRAAVALVENKATADELEDYRQFVLTLAQKVAAAHREDGQDVSPAEASAIEEIRTALGPSA
jgi:peptidyl-tRNA hydrolase